MEVMKLYEIELFKTKCLEFMSQYFPLEGCVGRGLFFAHSNSFTFTFMFVEETKSELYFPFPEMPFISFCTLGDEVWTTADCYLKLHCKENSN